MVANDPNKLNKKRTVALSLSFTIVLLAWSYFNFKVPRVLDVLIVEEIGKQTLKGIIMSLDNFVAVILQPFFGKLSDRTKSKLGRRIPFILIGVCASAFFLAVMPWVQFLLGFVLVILCFDVAMSFYRTVAIAILPDYTPEKFRNEASALQQFVANLGGVVGFAVPIITGLLVGLSAEWQLGSGFLIVAVIMMALLVIQLLLVKETPTGARFFQVAKKDFEIDPLTLVAKVRHEETVEEKVNVYKEIGLLFRAPEKSFLYMLFVVFFAYLGFAAIEGFFSTFASAYLGKADGPSGTLFLAYSVPMILTAPIWGIVGRKLGRRRAAQVGLLGIIISTIVLSFVLVPASYNPRPLDSLETNITVPNMLLMLNLAFISIPWMCFIVNSFPIIWNLAPEGRVGAYTGIYYTFNQLAYSLAPTIMGLILDAFGFLGSQQYVVMFPFILVLIVASFLLMFKVKRGDLTPTTPNP